MSQLKGETQISGHRAGSCWFPLGGGWAESEGSSAKADKLQTGFCELLQEGTADAGMKK